MGKPFFYSWLFSYLATESTKSVYENYSYWRRQLGYGYHKNFV